MKSCEDTCFHQWEVTPSQKAVARKPFVVGGGGGGEGEWILPGTTQS